jgi:hypothetical protein
VSPALNVQERVARYILKPKIPIWVNFGGPLIGKCRYLLWPIGIFDGHLGYFIATWYIMCSFGTFSSFGIILYQEKSGNPGAEKRRGDQTSNQTRNEWTDKFEQQQKK